jgi:hypothetical protein
MIALAGACKVKDPLFCSPDHPCTDPARSYCDLTGEYEPENIRNTCVASPFDAMPPQKILASETVTIAEGATSEVGVTLAIAPSGSVTVDVATANPLVATVSPSTLTFTAADYDTPKKITVQGVIDGDVIAETTSVSLTATDAAAASVAVTVTDARGGVWSSPQIVDDSVAHGIVSGPDVAMSPGGEAFALWEQYDPSNTMPGFWANGGTAAGPWGSATVAESYNGTCVLLPAQHVAVDPMGNAVAVWARSLGDCLSGKISIWANRYTKGVGWSTAQLLETDEALSAYDPQIVFDRSGDALAVWYQDGTHTHILASRLPAGGSWSSPQLLETNNVGGADSPRIAMDGGGNAIVVWQQYDGAKFDIWATRYVNGSGWGTPQLLESGNTDARYPEVGVGANGDATAVWVQRDATRFNVWANRYVANNGWGVAQLIETSDLADAWYPHVAMDSIGNAVAVWYQSDGNRDNIWANRYTAGIGWGAAQLLETNNAGRAFDPRVVLDSGGSALAVWAQSDGTHDSIWANRFLVSTGWATPQLLETDASTDHNNPALAIDSSGNAVAAWRTRDKVLVARFR